MIKFFRNVRKHLINEGKTARYLTYAIGEIALVVIGILIALSINNWNDRRKESQIEIKALIDLKNEFLENKAKMEKSIESKKNGLNKTAMLLEKIKSQNAEFENFNMSYGLNTINPTYGVIDKLTSTGKIDYVENDSLKKLLSGWKDLIIDYVEIEKNHRNLVFEKIFPLNDKLLPVVPFWGTGEIQNWNFYTNAENKLFFENAIHNLEFRNNHIRNYNIVSLVLDQSDKVMNTVNEILLLLDSEIQKKKY